MSNKHKKYIPILTVILVIELLTIVAIIMAMFLQDSNFAILNPKGFIASEQKKLIIRTIATMFIVALPVLFTTFFFAWKYRANGNSKYEPNLDRSPKLQLAWWAALCMITLVLAIIATKGSHALDPRKPLESTTDPLTIQVVALEWKWLFIYPEQNIASVNFLQFPKDTPINFEITADAPMNSFWIPQLGGQMYAMSGMVTKLSLIASEVGIYSGFSNNISGEGFAGMKFIAKASSAEDFNAWVETVRFYGNKLDLAEYEQLAKQSHNNPTAYFRPQDNLFNAVVMKFMAPSKIHMEH
jgi:cytochrome o ubiquinol oxidase subunit II